MRAFSYGAAALALAILFSPDLARAALATSASSLFEATPFVAIGILLARLLGSRYRMIDYLGCGCGAGPSALSIPAAAAAWFVFGAPIAIARFSAAFVAARVRRRIVACMHAPKPPPVHPLGELAAVVPAAALAGAAAQILATYDLTPLTPAANVLAGAALGFAAAPCGLGSVAVAGALHARAPAAAAGFLCVAGIADMRALRVRPAGASGHDAFAYAVLALGLAVVAWRHGDALVNPAMSFPLWCSAIGALFYAVRHRRERCPRVRVAPLLMLAGAILGAAPPQYRATETTLTDVFPGEHLTFTGALARRGSAGSVVRYAITCCRADAAPVAVVLDRAPPYPNGTWIRVEGLIENAGGELRLSTRRVTPLDPPADPFVYR